MCFKAKIQGLVFSSIVKFDICGEKKERRIFKEF